MIYESYIPEEDRRCVNCRHLLESDDDNKCGGVRACLNYKGEYTENYFEPARDYILTEIAGCENCRHKDDVKHYCSQCMRNTDLDDMWEGDEDE